MADALLPPPLAGDERFRALGQLAARISDIDLSPLLVYLIDTVNASALPHLAEQFHVLNEGWQFARDDDERRRLLKQAIALHRTKGTPWAIKNALASLGWDARISEWFEYGGDPYRFRVDVELSGQGISDAEHDAIAAMIDAFKNVRSWLDRLRLIATTRASVRIGGAALGGDDTSVYPYIVPGITLERPGVRVGIGLQAWGSTTVYPFGIGQK
jgi:phage tail P2-like protein